MKNAVRVNHLDRNSRIPEIYSFVKCYGICIFFALIFFSSTWTLLAQEECEWHNFHGPDRLNKSSDTGLLKKWPDEGPHLMWTATGLGEGYSSISIAEGHLFTAGMINNITYVYAFDLNGNLVWKKQNGQS